MTQHTASQTDEHHSEGHVVSPKVLWLNGIALLILTWITVAVAQIDFSQYQVYELNIIVALAVATTKATLVCLFFMHLYWDRPFNAFVLVASLAFVGLFMMLAMLDTFEYASQMIPGDSGGVIQRLQQLE